MGRGGEGRPVPPTGRAGGAGGARPTGRSTTSRTTSRSSGWGAGSLSIPPSSNDAVVYVPGAPPLAEASARILSGSWPAVSSSVGGGGAHRRRAARAPRRSPCDPRRRETRAEARGAAPRCPHRGPARARPSRDPGGGCATRRVVQVDESVVDADDRFSSRLAALFPGNDRHFRGGSPRAGHSSCARRGSRRVRESTVVRRTTRREASRVQLLAASLCS